MSNRLRHPQPKKKHLPPHVSKVVKYVHADLVKTRGMLEEEHEKLGRAKALLAAIVKTRGPFVLSEDDGATGTVKVKNVGMGRIEVSYTDESEKA